MFQITDLIEPTGFHFTFQHFVLIVKPPLCLFLYPHLSLSLFLCRLFQSIQQSWLSASGGQDPRHQTLATNSLQDVRELTPEFFYLSDLLRNVNRYPFGAASTGVLVGDVRLPAWTLGGAEGFVRQHREALECDYVSRHLHLWVDLIFGYKQVILGYVFVIECVVLCCWVLSCVTVFVNSKERRQKQLAT